MGMKNLFDVQDKIIVVTGGLGQLGREYVLALAERGARVCAVDVTDDAAAIAKRYPTIPERVHFYKADVTDKATLETVLAHIVQQWGVPHVLINNAALDSPPNAPAEENGPFETYPIESFDKIMAVNTKGVLLCCQVFGSAMAQAGRGSIINISSIYGIVSPVQDIYTYRAERDGKPFYKPVAYSVSKSALTNLTHYLATYWARRGVRVNTLTLAGVFNQQDEQFLAGYLARMPLGRMANPDEYNGAVIFLASDASSYMTGANLVIDGGWTAW
jgi:NAD(P)-dependent dehydrogenase (short-subunit alcohol dehydrogenase family)